MVCQNDTPSFILISQLCPLCLFRPFTPIPSYTDYFLNYIFLKEIIKKILSFQNFSVTLQNKRVGNVFANVNEIFKQIQNIIN